MTKIKRLDEKTRLKLLKEREEAREEKQLMDDWNSDINTPTTDDEWMEFALMTCSHDTEEMMAIIDKHCSE